MLLPRGGQVLPWGAQHPKSIFQHKGILLAVRVRRRKVLVCQVAPLKEGPFAWNITVANEKVLVCWVVLVDEDPLHTVANECWVAKGSLPPSSWGPHSQPGIFPQVSMTWMENGERFRTNRQRFTYCSTTCSMLGVYNSPLLGRYICG